MQLTPARATMVIAVATIAMLVGAFWYLDRLEAAQRSQGIVAPRSRSRLQLLLIAAIKEGKAAEVDEILSSYPQLLTQGIVSEGTPLHIAARYNQRAILALLLDRGAALNAKGVWGGTPLHWAAWWGASDAAKELIKRGAAVEGRDPVYDGTPLLWAAHGSNSLRNPRGDYAAVARVLLEAGANADTRNRAGVSACSLAAPEVAEILKAHGAHADAPATAPFDAPGEEPRRFEPGSAEPV